MKDFSESRAFEAKETKTLIHHCEGGQWFYDKRDLNKSGTFAYDSEKDEHFHPNKRVCQVCQMTTAQMEDEYKKSHPDYLTEKDPLNPK